LTYCETGQITPTADTCYDLFRLARHPAYSELMQLLHSAVLEKPAELAIPALRFADECQYPADELEAILRTEFLQCPIHQLTSLPISRIARIIHFPPPSNGDLFTKTFDLVLQMYDRFKGEISILFKSVNRLSLSQEQSRKLKEEGSDGSEENPRRGGSLEPHRADIPSRGPRFHIPSLSCLSCVGLGTELPGIGQTANPKKQQFATDLFCVSNNAISTSLAKVRSTPHWWLKTGWGESTERPLLKYPCEFHRQVVTICDLLEQRPELAHEYTVPTFLSVPGIDPYQIRWLP
jgi:hypothetical protein